MEKWVEDNIEWVIPLLSLIILSIIIMQWKESYQWWKIVIAVIFGAYFVVWSILMLKK